MRIRWFVLCVLDFTFLREQSERTECYLWYNGLVDRETNSVVNGRIELRRSGDILVATNGVERLVLGQLPFGHNGFGQDNEWVAANFIKGETF